MKRNRNWFLTITVMLIALLSLLLVNCDSGLLAEIREATALATAADEPAEEHMWPVHFNLNYAGASNPEPVMVADGNRVQRPADPVREDYVFENWYSDQGSQFIWVFTTPITSVTYLYAKWNVGYAVIYNSNDATSGSPPATQTKAQGVDLALASNSGNLQRTGYTFVGWNTNAAGTGDHYAEGATYDVDEVITLYAEWSANTYTVTLDTDGGSGGGIVEAIFGQTMPLAGAAPTKTGVGFAGYYTERNGEGIQYYTSTMDSARVWDLAMDTTLFAYWLSEVTIDFDTQGGIGGTSTVAAIFGSPMPEANAPERTGYTFDGYWDDPIGGEQYYTAAMSSAKNWDKTIDTTLYARWTATTYSIMFHPNEGSGTMQNQPVDYDQTVPLTSNGFTRTGYTFAGWSTSAGGSVAYGNGAAYTHTIADNMNLYAVWALNTYAIVYHRNGGAGTMQNQPVDYDQTVTLTANGFTRIGYTFDGWSTSAGGPVAYANGASYRHTITSNRNLYARWAPRTYTVTLNNQNGIGGTTSVTATYDWPMPAAEPPTRTGYVFDGYYTGTGGGGTQYYTASMASARNWDRTVNTTLYAKWRDYVVGETGPAGGIVFYDRGSYSGGWRYLEAWTTDEDGLYQWKTSNTSTSGTSTEIGSGYDNTYLRMTGTQHPAAEVCRMANHGGVIDWFLPSIDELELMYQNLYLQGNGGYWSSYYYASSSEFSETAAFKIKFKDGFMPIPMKTDNHSVRAVRRF